MSEHRLSLEEARRIAIRAQQLDATRPTDLVALVHGLTLLQIDPTAAIAPSADLVAWSRLGESYQPADLQRALEHDRTLFERDAMVRPMRRFARETGDACARWASRARRGPPSPSIRWWLATRASPLPSREFPARGAWIRRRSDSHSKVAWHCCRPSTA